MFLRRHTHLAWLAALLVVWAVPVSGLEFLGRDGPVMWQAEDARPSGRWQRVQRADADGGVFVQAAGEGALEFRFATTSSTTLRVWPVWWQHGPCRAARRFPYPLERALGPDAVDALGGLVCFTAPYTGRVGVVDGASERLVRSVDVGGYLTDLVADAERGVVWVADALGARVVAVDPKSGAITTEVTVPDEPWSLVLSGSRLLVACRGGRSIAAVDPGSAKVVQVAATAARPVNLALAPGSTDRVVVRFEPGVFGMSDGTPELVDRLECPAGENRAKAKVGATTFEAPEPGKIRATGGGKTADIDLTQSVGAGAATALLAVGKELFFAIPQAGKVGVIDAEGQKVAATIDVGGRPVDMCLDAGRGQLWVADAASDRVVVVDTKSRKVAAEVPGVGQGPCSVAYVNEVALQRPYLVPPTRIDRVYVASREGQALTVIDAASRAVVSRPSLGAPVRRVAAIAIPANGWWPTMADDRIALNLTPRVAAELEPAVLAVADLSPAEPPAALPSALQRRGKTVARFGPTAREKTYTADNQLVLGVDGRRWVDVSSVADPQLAPARALAGADQPGSIAVSLDGGPEFDWTRQIWMAPANEAFLVNGTESFAQWNAPTFAIGPGEHVIRVRATEADVALDALRVWRSGEGICRLDLAPLPASAHAGVSLPGYYGVFYDNERPEFRLILSGPADRPVTVDGSYELRNYMGEVVRAGELERMTLRPGSPRDVALSFSPKETGRFHLAVHVNTEQGPIARTFDFARLPRLEHPRLIYRADQKEAIRRRIAEHPRLFARYTAWLRRKSAETGGRFPELFMPPGLTAADLVASRPESMSAGDAGNAYAWRMYELGWRILACQFASDFLEPEGERILGRRVDELLGKGKTDYYCEFHHHGPFFPGAVAGTWDMAPEATRSGTKLKETFEDRLGDMNVYPWTLVTLEEPMTPEKRAMVAKIMQWENNLENYFATHQGARGGTWWQNPWTGCNCPIHGQLLAFLYSSNFLGESRMFEKPLFTGFLTFNRLVDPLADTRRILPNTRGPQGEPWRFILSSLPRHPLEATLYEWDDWYKKLDGDLPQPEDQAVDRLMDLEGMKLDGRLWGGSSQFVTGAFAPVALALGWYDPAQPRVEREELPETTLFDVEGWATMRSDWGPGATEVSFMSGVRDHTYRHQPNHFTIVHGGQFLAGTPTTWGDDGNCNPAWGNVVVTGDKWLNRWSMSLQAPRYTERALVNRFSPETWAYIGRDRRLTGFSPAENGFGGGVNLHGHTQTLLTQEGRVVAYETSPAFDYIAGDATGAWPTSEVRQALRQLVFVKPDLVVIYDRLVPTDAGASARWLACVGTRVTTDGPRFRVLAGDARLLGEFVLPARATVTTPPRIGSFAWKDQTPIAVEASAEGGQVEFLTVLRVGGADLTRARVTRVDSGARVGVRVVAGESTVEVLFDRGGPAGGTIRLRTPRGSASRGLASGVEDTYARWSGDPRYAKWVSEPRFAFIIPEPDRQP